ncbi:adenosylcobinamide-GDP ribazoletransferase [Candidatus Bathyarchaeota archaeon]|nr:adenosylcobinamide-GDP ribazoletransferase [Candidatus Bathyarchaeota archaeon]
MSSAGGLIVKALRVFRGLMAFLTAIPFKMDESFLDISARYMFLFPVIGAIIGFLVGLYARFTNNVLFFLFGYINTIVFSGSYEVLFEFVAKGLASAMTIAFLLVIIGLQHTDGLVDVGNALGIRKASLKEKMNIAHVWTVTRTGAFLAVLVCFFTLLLIFLTKTDVVIQSLIVAEVSAKLAMVTTAWQGTSPPPRFYENKWEKGRNFIDSIRKKHGLYAISLIISLVVSIALLGLSGVLSVAAGILVGGFMIIVGKQVFGGVNGDIFGATNEIARMVALLVLVI